jgi:hypothetical protein
MLWAVGNSQREEHKDLLHVDSPDPNPLHKALRKRVLLWDLLNV